MRARRLFRLSAAA